MEHINEPHSFLGSPSLLLQQPFAQTSAIGSQQATVILQTTDWPSGFSLCHADHDLEPRGFVEELNNMPVDVMNVLFPPDNFGTSPGGDLAEFGADQGEDERFTQQEESIRYLKRLERRLDRLQRGKDVARPRGGVFHTFTQKRVSSNPYDEDEEDIKVVAELQRKVKMQQQEEQERARRALTGVEHQGEGDSEEEEEAGSRDLLVEGGRILAVTDSQEEEAPILAVWRQEQQEDMMDESTLGYREEHIDIAENQSNLGHHTNNVEFDAAEGEEVYAGLISKTAEETVMSRNKDKCNEKPYQCFAVMWQTVASCWSSSGLR